MYEPRPCVCTNGLRDTMLTARVQFCLNYYALIAAVRQYAYKVAGWVSAKGQSAQPTVHSEIKGILWNIEMSCFSHLCNLMPL